MDMQRDREDLWKRLEDGSEEFKKIWHSINEQNKLIEESRVDIDNLKKKVKKLETWSQDHDL